MLVITLKDKSESNITCLISIWYISVTIICASFGIIGAYVYRNNGSVLILNNMLIYPGNTFVIIVSIIKIINSWSSYAIHLTYIADIAENLLLIQENEFNKRYLVCVGVFMFTLLIAYLCRYHLAVMTAIGSACDSAFGPALLLPVLVFMGLFYDKLSFQSKLAHILLSIFAIFVGSFVIYSSFHGLL